MPKKDFLKIIQDRRKNKKDEKFSGTFIDYLELIRENPKIVRTQFGNKVKFNKNRSNSNTKNNMTKNPCSSMSISKCMKDTTCNWVWDKGLYLQSGHCE